MHKDVGEALYLLSKMTDCVSQIKIRLDQLPAMLEDIKHHVLTAERSHSDEEVSAKFRAIRDILDEAGVIDY